MSAAFQPDPQPHLHCRLNLLDLNPPDLNPPDLNPLDLNRLDFIRVEPDFIAFFSGFSSATRHFSSSLCTSTEIDDASDFSVGFSEFTLCEF